MALTDTSIGNLSGCGQLMHLRVHGEDEDTMSRETRHAWLGAGRTASKKRPRPKMPVVRASVLCFSLVLIAGCGSTTKTTAAAPTRAQYIATVDPICRASDAAERPLNAKIEAILAMHLSDEASGSKLAPLYRSNIAAYRRFIKQVAAVPQPPGDKEILGKIAIAHKDLAAVEEREVPILEHFEAEAWKAVSSEDSEIGKHLYALEQGYGFKVCGSEASGQTKSHTATPLGLRIGEAATIGSLVIRPTSFVRYRSNGSEAIWRATITATNNGSTGVTPFCRIAEEWASLIDSKERVYEAQHESQFEGSCETIEPGLSNSHITVDFKMPADAKPATLDLWGEKQYESKARAWSVG